MTQAFIGLGCNLGDRVAAIAAAVRGIAAVPGVFLLDVSRVYESEPWGVEGQPAFANAVVRVDAAMSADRLLDVLKGIEECLGRIPGERYGPRAIDLDLLLFGDEEWDSPDLVLPHPRLLERDFVVTPLLAIAPAVEMPDGAAVTRGGVLVGRVVSELGAVPGFEGPPAR